MAEVIEDVGLRIRDIAFLRLHHTIALRCACARFSARADVIAALKVTQFVRTSQHGTQDVLQFQLCRSSEAVPITRD